MDQTTIDNVIGFLKASLIEHSIQVASIAVFGSVLKGNMDTDSDIDLIIISPDFRNLDIFERARLTMKPEMETQKKFNIPMDILNLSPEEYDDSKLRVFSQSKIVA